MIKASKTGSAQTNRLDFPAARAEVLKDMIDPEEWLTNFAPGYAGLKHSERQAIAYFCFLWSLFEAQKLKRAASAKSIVEHVQRFQSQDRLQGCDFERPLAYFKNRYFSNKEFTPLFFGLNFRACDRRSMVEVVLSGKEKNLDYVVVALLLIVYRLRNNLFHGEKWAYGIAEQEGNFTNANYVLMEAMRI
jgi:hypothetical protein